MWRLVVSAGEAASRMSAVEGDGMDAAGGIIWLKLFLMRKRSWRSMVLSLFRSAGLCVCRFCSPKFWMASSSVS